MHLKMMNAILTIICIKLVDTTLLGGWISFYNITLVASSVIALF